MRVMIAVVVSMLSFAMACGPGPQGERGPQGAPGASGPSVNDTVVYVCEGFVGTSVAVFAGQYTWEFPDKSLMTTCIVQDGGWQSTSTLMYRAKDGGAVSADCQVMLDVSGNLTGGGYRFRLAADRVRTTVTAIDSDSPDNNRAYPVSCTKT